MTIPQMISTPVTELLGIKHPVLLAGMNATSGPKLAAAVTNAGGLGVIGGVSYSPQQLSDAIDELRSYLDDKSAPFGVDLLIPKVGGGARKTNTDYLKGNLPILIDLLIAKKVFLFVSAVGLPPKWAVDKLHANGILFMNMCGAPKHAVAAADLGADLICATGGEAGGHTGDIPTTVLLPEVKKLLRGRKSALTGKQIPLVGGGGVYTGRSVAGLMNLGADAVWVGTRFILAQESGSSDYHRKQVQNTKHGEVVRTTIFTGRPMHALGTPYVLKWEEERRDEMKELQAKGIVPVYNDMEKYPDDDSVESYPVLMGKVAGAVDKIQPAREIVEDLVTGAAEALAESSRLLVGKGSKL